MQIPYKYILLALTLTFGLAMPPVHAEPPEPTPAPLWAVPTPLLQTMPEISLKPLEPLKMADFKYSAPMTHSSPYPTGQCTWLASTMKGNIPSWGNANSWDDGARASGKTVSPVPVVGAVAQTDRGYYGHVAVVVGVHGDTITITEGNYDYNGSIRTHTVPTSTYVYIYL